MSCGNALKRRWNLDIKSFRDFPRAVSEMPDDLKDTPVVMFCTGGIRCEKASVVMLDAGFTNVKQLKGGFLDILKRSVVHIGMGIVLSLITVWH